MWHNMQLEWRPTAPPGTRNDDDAEWLVTNGIGGFAAGTVSGTLTRRYHGLLVAALRPPVERRLMWAKCDEHLVTPSGTWPLSTNDYGDVTHPVGWRHVHSFHVYPFPMTVLAAAGIVIRRTVFMIYGQNTTAVTYELLAGPADVELHLEPLINCRDYHHTVRRNEWPFRQDVFGHGVGITAYAGAPSFVLAAGSVGDGESDDAAVTYDADGRWFHDFHYALERKRGLDCVEDHFRPGTFRVRFSGPGDVAVIVGHCAEPSVGGARLWADGPKTLARRVLAAYEEAAERRARVVQRSPEPGERSRRDGGTAHPDWQRLVLAADDFVVYRQTTGAATIVAGYPWFTDWGRDAMISLPGLLLATGRYDTAREVLLTFAHHRADGLIPNRFPDDGGDPLYNTVDASLWFVNAVWQYAQATGDETTVQHELLPVALDVLHHYARGTRHGIGIDGDGLVRAHAPGLQLTWMDAKAGDWVVTPRAGVPVEINALWYSALRAVATLAMKFAPADAARWRQAATVVRRAFVRRFVQTDGSLYDVIPPRLAAPSFGNLPVKGGAEVAAADASLRPNQIFALSLPFPVLGGTAARRVLHNVAHHLLTPVGLRTLSPTDPDFRGTYYGDQRRRDGAYHRGTVWPWLLGPFLTALRRFGDGSAYGGSRRTYGLWGGLRAHMHGEAVLGHVSEIFEGTAPYAARGCFAQAWSVAELLRVWAEEAGEHRDES